MDERKSTSQEEVYNLIKAFNFTTGRYPNFRQIIQYTTIQSVSNVSRVVKKLTKEKKLDVNEKGRIVYIYRDL